MNETRIVAWGVDTLAVNAFYTDRQGKPTKRGVDESLVQELDAWKKEVQAEHREVPTLVVFHGKPFGRVVGPGAGAGRLIKHPWEQRHGTALTVCAHVRGAEQAAAQRLGLHTVR